MHATRSTGHTTIPQDGRLTFIARDSIETWRSAAGLWAERYPFDRHEEARAECPEYAGPGANINGYLELGPPHFKSDREACIIMTVIQRATRLSVHEFTHAFCIEQ